MKSEALDAALAARTKEKWRISRSAAKGSSMVRSPAGNVPGDGRSVSVARTNALPIRRSGIECRLRSLEHVGLLRVRAPGGHVHHRHHQSCIWGARSVFGDANMTRRVRRDLDFVLASSRQPRAGVAIHERESMAALSRGSSSSLRTRRNIIRR